MPVAAESSPFGTALVKVVSREAPEPAAPLTFGLARFRLVYRMKKCWLAQLEPSLALGDQTRAVAPVMDGICALVFE